MAASADLHQGLRSFLLADTSIGAVVDTRVFPVVLPQRERRPSIVYTRISGLGDYHMQEPSGLARPRYQLDAYAEEADDAAALADLIKTRLDGFAGPMGATMVQGVFIDGERQDYQPEAKLHRASRDYLIWFEER